MKDLLVYSFSNYIIQFVISVTNSNSTFTSASTSTYLLILMLIILLLWLISLVKHTENSTVGLNIFISIWTKPSPMGRQLVTNSSNFIKINLEKVTNQFGNWKQKLVTFFGISWSGSFTHGGVLLFVKLQAFTLQLY